MVCVRDACWVRSLCGLIAAKDKNAMPDTFTVPPLVSGGIMLTYHCNNACRHCLYRCSPAQDESFMSEAMIDRVFDMLSREHSFSGVHIAGGEATLNMERLEYALRSAANHRVRIDYLETNGRWCDTFDAAKAGFERLRSAGLNAVLISASLFHNEFIPLRHTENAIQAASEVFGVHGVIVWTPDVLSLMQQRLDPDRTHTLKESCEILGLSMSDVWRLHSYLTPSGRAAEALSAGLKHKPAEAFASSPCACTLERTSHFHITPDGSIYTGLCPGLAIGTVDDPHPERSADDAPAYAALRDGGPAALMRLAGHAFTPDPKGYIGECHLCMDIRKHLDKTGQYDELRPDAFYR